MRRYTLALSLAAGLFILFASGTGAQAGRVSGLSVAQAASGPPVRYGVQVSSAARHDVSPPLRDLHGAPATGHAYPTRPIRVPGSSGDTTVSGNSSPALALSVTPGLNFAGVGNGDYGFA